MNFIFDFIKGLAIGIGAIAPGVSGGTIAVIFGLYEKITDAIASGFKDFKKKALFFFPIALGGGIGVLAFSRIMNYLFENYNVEVKYLFIGLMAGTLSTVFKHANKYGFNKKYILSFIMAFSITLLFTLLENSAINIVPDGKPGIIQFAIYGAIIGFGTIVPGISASFILMYLGVYQTILEGISNIDLAVLIPAGTGFIFSIFVLAKLINMLFKKAYGFTYYAVLGFVIGSIVPIFPGIEFNLKYLICLLLFVIGFYLSSCISKYANDN